MNNPKSEVKYARNLGLFDMSKTLLRCLRSSQMSMRCTMQKAFWVKSTCGFSYVFCMFFVPSLIAPRCSTSSPTSLLFVVSGAVHLATSGPNPPMTLPRIPEGKATGVQPKGSSTFCSVTRLQWFTLITRSYTNRKLTGSDCPLGLFPTDRCKKVMKMNRIPKLVELCGTPGHLKRKKKNLKPVL